MKGENRLISCDLPYCSNSMDCFERLRPLGSAVLLDSGEGYPDHIDIYTAAPHLIHQLTSQTQGLNDSFAVLRRKLLEYKVDDHLNHPAPGWFGVWSYDLGAITESVMMRRVESTLPLIWMGFYPALIVSDHQLKSTKLVTLPGFEEHAQWLKEAYLGPLPPSNLPFHLTKAFSGNLPHADYKQRFSRVEDYIHNGDCYQINLAQRFQAPFEGAPWQAYKKLRANQSSPMGGYIEAKEWALLSLSPERFVRCKDGIVDTKPIKGTRPRSEDPAHDQALIQSLLHSEKDRAENLMIVDLLRNDLGRSCKVGSVKVDKLFDIESFSNVHHMVSTITGVLKPDLDALDLLAGAFPGGSITGAPKRRAMEIIEELEPHGREFYCGSLLYLDVCGRMDSNILIRSIVAQDGAMRCWGGGGVVADSTCDAEYQEIQDKIGNLLKTLQ